jgi:hypothetical protein
MVIDHEKTTTSKVEAPMPSWRDVLPIHPAAALMPALSREELEELGADIKRRGLINPIILVQTGGRLELLDGANRLDAAELAGIPTVDGEGRLLLLHETILDGLSSGEAQLEVVSLNIRRRHLFGKKLEPLIQALRKLGTTDRTIAKKLRVDQMTVARVEREPQPQPRVSNEENSSLPPDAAERFEVSGRKARGRVPGVGGPRRPVPFDRRLRRFIYRELEKLGPDWPQLIEQARRLLDEIEAAWPEEGAS